MSKYNPYRSPFLRKSLARRAGVEIAIHPLERLEHENYFRKRNPSGYQHDLGAQDLFLDDLGMLCRDQFNGNEPLLFDYLNHARWLRELWLLTGHQVIREKPWWGQNFNIHTRKANAGEPRNVVRFMADRELGALTRADLLSVGLPDSFVDRVLQHGQPSIGPAAGPLGRLLEFTSVGPADDRGTDALDDLSQALLRYADWDPWDLVPGRTAGDRLPERELPRGLNLGGVILPSGGPSHVSELKVLHPRESTPDLAPRVGIDPASLRGYRQVLRDQGRLGTCIAHALAVGLKLLADRVSSNNQPFSPLWIHRAAGFSTRGGGSLSAAVEAIRTTLPCSEAVFPYPPPNRQELFASGTWEPETAGQLASRAHLTERLGPPVVETVRPQDIARIKARLAAGWLVVVSTRLTDDFLNYGLRQIGLGLRPLLGQPYRPEGHAWLLVGYDHVDGRNDWKYQGRFFALNSWGRDYPTARKPFGPVSSRFRSRCC
jgi:hypothetical protein